MKYSVKVVRSYYNRYAIRERKQTDEQFFTDIDVALIAYNSSIIGEKVSGKIHSNDGSLNIYVSLIVRIDGKSTVLESVFLHNGEVQ